MGTKNAPGKFDCYDNADPNEPMFILLGRDLAAPRTILEWVYERLRLYADKPNLEQLLEALQCARTMLEWRPRVSAQPTLIEIQQLEHRLRGRVELGLEEAPE